MKEAEHLNLKPNFDIRKRPINGKLFQNQKPLKEQFLLNSNKKTMGKKYMQQPNIFKPKHDEPKKQHREIVMSEEFIRSSKLYRLLKQKIDRSDSIFIKQVNSMNEHKIKLKQEIMHIRSQNYQEKVSLWELKNKLMELKIMYHEEEEQSKRLGEQNYGEYQAEEQYEGEHQGQNQEENNGEDQQQEPYNEAIEDDQTNNHDHAFIHNLNDQFGNSPYQQLEEEQQQKPGQEQKSQFTEILEELMNLKGQINQEEKQQGMQQKIQKGSPSHRSKREFQRQ